VIVYYHGNAGSACDRSFLKSTFEIPNTSILFVEYTGYSADPQKPSKNHILQDVHNTYDFIDEQNFSHIIIIGTSLGASAASYHASLGQVDKLLLISPFLNTFELAKSKYPFYPVSFILKENYTNDIWLQYYTEELLVLHGSHDIIIPPKFSQQLFRIVPTENKKYQLIQKASHNTIFSTSETFQEMHSFIQ